LTDPELRLYCEARTAFFGFTRNIGKPRCQIPSDGFAWKPTRQPVALDVWARIARHHEGRYTTVMQWGSYPAQIYQGLRLAAKCERFHHSPISATPRTEI